MPTGREQVIHDHVVLTASSLTTGQVTTSATKITAAKEQGFRIKKVKAMMAWNGKTTLLGPAEVGVAVDLTGAEVKEALDADPTDNRDVPAVEQGNRPVWPLWIIPASSEVDSNQQHEMKVVYWPYKEAEEGQAVVLYMRNLDTVTLTALIADVRLVYFGEWLRD